MFTKSPKSITTVLIINKICSLIFKLEFNSDMLFLKECPYFILFYFKAPDSRLFFFNLKNVICSILRF